MFGEAFDQVLQFLQSLIAADSPWRGPLLALATAVVAWVLYRLTRAALRRYLNSRALKPENAQNFLLIYRYVYMAIAFVLVMISLSGSIAALGISAAFLGMIMGWSLQAPVTGIAAWLMIILKRPFKIGDRVIIAGITGDVMDINLTHIILNQVGGTVGGEERSGRGVMIPNATLFQQVIYNYSYEAKYLLDEVTLLITFGSDFGSAENIMLGAAQGVTADIIDETGNEPYVRAEIADSGIRLRLRYNTISMDRQRVSTDIVKRVMAEINAAENVEFSYPHMEILHREKRGVEVFPKND